MVSRWHTDGRTHHLFGRPRLLWPFDPSPTIKSIARAAFAVEPSLKFIVLAERHADFIEVLLNLKQVDEDSRKVIAAAAPVTATVQFLDYTTYFKKEGQVGTGPQDRGLLSDPTSLALSMLRPCGTRALKRKPRLVVRKRLQSALPET